MRILSKINVKKDTIISRLLLSLKSVKSRLTIWCGYFMFLIIILSLSFLFVISRNDTMRTLKNNLQIKVNHIGSEISRLNSDINLNVTISYNDNIYIVIYDQNRNLIYSNSNIEDYSFFDNFADSSLRPVTLKKDSYYIYDKIIFITDRSFDSDFIDIEINALKNLIIEFSPDYTILYIRGYAHIEPVKILNKDIFRNFLIFLPLLILIASIGFHYIVKKAFQPMTNIMDTTKSIVIGNDFSNHIEITSRDEFANLSLALNQFFDNTRELIEKERQFTSDASHELKTPMAVIFAQAEYLQSICEKPEEKQSCQVIINQTVKINRLISELLTLTRMEHHKQILSLEEINLSELLELIIEEASDNASEYNITIYSDIQPNIRMNADQTMLMRVFMNLINNSIKYGIPGGWIKIHMSKSEEHIFFSISDNGIGISKENIPKIWERFFQANPSRSNEKGGSGLGLSIVKWIVEAHSGKITVESELNAGSTFKIIFKNIN